jgi:serine/threonine protein kinase
LKVLNVYEDENITVIVFDCVQGRELFQWILKRGFISEAATPAITTQILLGVKVLHDNGMTHLDLKPENILIVESPGQVFTVKLTDYLLEGVFDEDLKIIGTRSAALHRS